MATSRGRSVEAVGQSIRVGSERSAEYESPTGHCFPWASCSAPNPFGRDSGLQAFRLAQHPSNQRVSELTSAGSGNSDGSSL
ncbi:hypothetical protein Y1Q_0000359 [Alligator mississippiensis]|uniref:Uncharacterized protein n=1 Tax=Alligator mississippiensis TaxID=8496 RepID=A0A151MZY8_ALLMI|nr:hypothetical protein Y1Q_0000359 [Alligator mississippiensis]